MGKLLGDSAFVGHRGISSPLVFSDLKLWLDASDLGTLFLDTSGTTPVTSDGQSVARWADKSGSNNHLTQATGTARPTYKTGVLNGRAALSFDGGDYMDSAGSLSSLPLTIVGVAKTDATTNVARGLVALRHSVNGGTRVLLTTGGSVQAAVSFPLESRTAGDALGVNQSFVFGLIVSATAVYALANGMISTPAAHTVADVPNIVRVGGSGINVTTFNTLGYIMDVCVYTSALTHSQVGQLMNYLRAKWAAY